MKTIAKLVYKGPATFSIQLKGMRMIASKDWPEDEVKLRFPNGEPVTYWHCKIIDGVPGIEFLTQATAEDYA